MTDALEAAIDQIHAVQADMAKTSLECEASMGRLRSLTADKPEGSLVCYQTEHYQIVDNGEDWRRGYTSRFFMQRRAEFARSRVMPFPPRGSRVSAEDLLPSLEEAEKFHRDNLPYCGGF